ncbi:MAG TPA: class I SAM-dependent methyltransferase [Devosia sp.]|nr:class I SAM-dependent methyltransferase [Devosia sp.]
MADRAKNCQCKPREGAIGIAARHRLAVEALALSGDENVLEIGCGHGVATRLVLERLTTGRITALDRSGKMTASLKSGLPDAGDRLRAIARAFEDVDWADQKFDAIFAVNVDLNLRLGPRWAPLMKSLLRADGRIVLAFEAPPGSDKGGRFADASRQYLAAQGFGVKTMHDESGVTLVFARFH